MQAVTMFAALAATLCGTASAANRTAGLSDVPQKPLWFGMWGSDQDSNGFSSLVWDAVQDSDVDQHGGGDLRFLYPVWKFFCQEQQQTGVCTLYSDYQSRWDNAVSKMKQYLSSGKIIGFFPGDERICKMKGTGVTDTIINTVRNDFPKGTAIIYINECGSTWPEHSMPEGADWVSVDRYRGDKDQDYVKDVKKIYDDIFKKLHSGQKVGLCPGVGHPRDHEKICDDECTANVELQDAKDFVEWAHSDDRVIFIAPYAWMRDGQIEVGLNQMSHNDELKQFYKKLGQSTK